MKRKEKIHCALLGLADRFEYGQLLAETQPSEFLDQVTREIDRLRAELADVAFLDDAARRFGSRLGIPPELPGLDEDHMHFVQMPIGAVSRRAAVLWLQAQGAPETVEVDWAGNPLPDDGTIA